MKKLLLVLVLVGMNGMAQQTFDYVKSMNSFKESDIKNTVSRVLTDMDRNPNKYSADDQLKIKNLQLFMANPFDTAISQFSFLESIAKLDELEAKLPKVIVSAIISPNKNSTQQRDSDNDGVTDAYDKCPNVAGTVRNNGCPESQDDDIKSLASLQSIVPTGSSITTQVIDEISKFLVERTKQELTLTFYENFKSKLETVIPVQVDATHTIQINLKTVFPNTFLLFESKNYFETPSLGQTWLTAFDKDLKQLPYQVEQLIRRDSYLSGLKEFRLALVSYDVIKKLKTGVHPITLLEELNQTYNSDGVYQHQVNQLIGYVQLLSQYLSKDVPMDSYKQVTWITASDWNSLSEKQMQYLMGILYQSGRSSGLFAKMKVDGVSLENLITATNYTFFKSALKNATTQFNLINQKVNDVKQSSSSDALNVYVDLITTLYGAFDATVENYYILLNKNAQYYQSDYYVTYKPLIQDFIAIEQAVSGGHYAECLLLTNRLLSDLSPNYIAKNEVLKSLTFYGNFMVDVITTARNNGNLKSVVEKYMMPVSSYRIKRQFNSSWDVNAYPGLYAGYEFSGSNSLSYGIAAPIGFSYSFKNKNLNNVEAKSGSTTLFISVIDIGAPFSYRFTNDEAEGLPDNIKWEQVFSPGFFFIHGFKNSPLALGLHAQFTPLLRSIADENELNTKNVFRVGLSLMVDIPLFNLAKK